MSKAESFLGSISWKKILIWSILLGLLYIMRDFFAIVFLTFVFSYISMTLVDKAEKRFGQRKLMVVGVFVGYLVILTLGSWTVFPTAYEEGQELVNRVLETEQMKEDGLATGIEQGDLPYVDSLLRQILGEETVDEWIRTDSYEMISRQVTTLIIDEAPNLIEGAGTVFKNVFTFTLHFSLALLFSFLILWDFNTLKQRIMELKDSRLSEFYEEVAPGVQSFFAVLGRAFEAQAMIAVANTLLTTIGILVMQIPNVAFLAVVVFFCSFIPVFGVILSSIPIALLAFKVGGPLLMFIAIIYILVVHGIEAYILNPQIYGAHMELHPLIVLMVLLVGEHFFGVWGLILGVPVFRYVWCQVILEEEPQFQFTQ